MSTLRPSSVYLCCPDLNPELAAHHARKAIHKSPHGAVHTLRAATNTLHGATGPQPKHRKPRRPELYVPYRSFEPCPTGTIVYLEKFTSIFFWRIQHKASYPTHSRTMKSEAENIFHQNNHFPGKVSNENVFI